MQLVTFLRSRSMSRATAVVLVTIAGACSGSMAEGPPMPYSDLVLRAAQGEVEAVVQEGTTLSVTLSGEALPQTVVVNEQLNVRQELCAAAGADKAGECRIRYEFAEPSAAGGLLTLLITALLPVLLIGGFIFFMMRRAAPSSQR
jgi:ATP-dependent Zn protease